MGALGTRRRFRAGLLRVEMIAADAVEADFPALDIIQRAIPSVIIEPQRRKQPDSQQAIEQDWDRQIRRRKHRKRRLMRKEKYLLLALPQVRNLMNSFGHTPPFLQMIAQ